jgi:tellurite methyltransferase
VSAEDRARWDARYQQESTIGAPSPFLRTLDADLPRAGRALDVAGGSGRNARWLAERGLDVTLVDISSRALALAQGSGVRMQVAALDLDQDPLPAGPFDLVVCIHYLNRALFPAFRSLLQPRGLLVFVQPTRTNLTRNPHPSARFLLEDGELPGLVAGLEILRYEEGWSTDEGGSRHEARLLARRP